jgi:hypothetical protein
MKEAHSWLLLPLFQTLKALTCSDSHVVDVIIGHDLASGFLGVVDTSV